MDNILTKRVYSKSKYIYRIYMERIEINVTEEQKWKGMLWLAHYNPEINYRIEVDIRKNGKIKKTTEFMKRVKKIQKEVGVALRKAWEKMKWQVDKSMEEER